MSFLSSLKQGVNDMLTPPPAGYHTTFAEAYNPEAYAEEVLLKQIADEINAMPIPPHWKKYFLANFKSQLAIEQAARPSIIASRAKIGITAYPITLKSILLGLRHPCFKARIRAMLKSEEEKYKQIKDEGLSAEDIKQVEEDGAECVLRELINGFAIHTDYDLDKNGLPIGARNSRAFLQYGKPPPEGCNMPKSPRYIGGKRKTKKRKTKKRKTKKRVSKKYA
jgi:hypothetical protein